MRNSFNLSRQIIIVVISTALEARGIGSIVLALSCSLELLIKHVIIGLLKWILDVVNALKVFIFLVHYGSCRFVLVLDQIILLEDVIALAAWILEKCFVRKLVLEVHRIASSLDCNPLATANAR